MLCVISLEDCRRAFFSSASIVRLPGAVGSTIPMMPQLIVPTHCIQGIYAGIPEMVPLKVSFQPVHVGAAGLPVVDCGAECNQRKEVVHLMERETTDGN